MLVTSYKIYLISNIKNIYFFSGLLIYFVHSYTLIENTHWNLTENVVSSPIITFLVLMYFILLSHSLPCPFKMWVNTSLSFRRHCFGHRSANYTRIWQTIRRGVILHNTVKQKHAQPQTVLCYVKHPVARRYIFHLKTARFWGVKRCNLVEVKRRFRRTCCPPHQSRSHLLFLGASNSTGTSVNFHANFTSQKEPVLMQSPMWKRQIPLTAFTSSLHFSAFLAISKSTCHKCHSTAAQYRARPNCLALSIVYSVKKNALYGGHVRPSVHWCPVVSD